MCPKYAQISTMPGLSTCLNLPHEAEEGLERNKPGNRVWRPALMVCWDSKTVIRLMCSSAGGWQKRDGGGNSEGKATGFRFHCGCDCHSGLKEKGPQSRITLKCHVSCLWVHVFVFILCSGRISTQWGATVRRIFHHLEVLLLGALYKCFSPWISSAWSCFYYGPLHFCLSADHCALLIHVKLMHISLQIYDFQVSVLLL